MLRLDLWLLAFCSMALLDVVWVLYMRAAAKYRAGAAALWAAAIHGFGALAVLSYVDDPRYLTGTMAGTIAGTYAVVVVTGYYDRKKEAKDAAG